MTAQHHTCAKEMHGSLMHCECDKCCIAALKRDNAEKQIDLLKGDAKLLVAEQSRDEMARASVALKQTIERLRALLDDCLVRENKWLDDAYSKRQEIERLRAAIPRVGVAFALDCIYNGRAANQGDFAAFMQTDAGKAAMGGGKA